MENKILGPAIRKGMEQGRQLGLEEGRTLGLRELLHDLQIPSWAESKPAAATPETLKAWSHRRHRADSLDDELA